ncbi:MAG: 1-acyl-sn-glycerol-3-phosphate acyltransferase [Pseudomonadota bacterium]|nr:1-acyl-sn-glycerol-3-phosphate acyltransferase [Pseudomonadota bacterium]
MIIFLRSLAFNAWFFGVTFVMGLYGVLLRGRGTDRVLAHAQRWAALVLAGVRPLAGIEIVVLGRENLPQGGAALIASQHQSAFDTVLWLQLVPRAAYVFKAELARIPLFGAMLESGGQIPVGRTAGAGSLRETLRAVDRAVADRRQIVVFPEGTRVAYGERAALQPGIALIARRARLPIVPIATNSGLAWPRRAFLKRPGRVFVVATPALAPESDQTALLAALRAAWDDGEAVIQRTLDAEKPSHD